MRALDEVNLTEGTEIKGPQALFSPGMSVDQNGVLYLCSAENAIYRLEPGKEHLELYGGVPGRDEGGVGANGKLMKATEAFSVGTGFANGNGDSTLPRSNSNGGGGHHGYGKFTRILSLDAIGTPGYIWVADYDAHVIRKIDCQNDYVMTAIGRAGSGGTYDADVSEARLFNPRSVIATTISSMSYQSGPNSAPVSSSNQLGSLTPPTATASPKKSGGRPQHRNNASLPSHAPPASVLSPTAVSLSARTSSSPISSYHTGSSHHNQYHSSTEGIDTVLFMASGNSNLRRVDLRTNKVSTLKLKPNHYEAMISSGESSVNDLFHPSLVHPISNGKSVLPPLNTPPSPPSSETSDSALRSSSQGSHSSFTSTASSTQARAVSSSSNGALSSYQGQGDIMTSKGSSGDSQSSHHSTSIQSPLVFPKPSPCTTWAHTSRQATWRINLETGDCSVLSDKHLHPLICFEENIVLVVESIRDWEYDLCISVALCPSAGENGLNDTPVTLKRLAKLPGDWLDKRARFTFCLLTNMLYAWNISNGLLVRYSNVLPADLLHELAPSNGYTSDLSSLLTSPIAHNLVITHAASKRSWNLHSDVLACHAGLETKDRIRKLESTLQSSPLPASSIHALIQYLYFKSIDTSDFDKACTETCHVIALCEAIGLDTRYLVNELATRIVAKMSNEAVCHQLLSAWFNKDIEWNETSAVIVILVERIRKHSPASTFLSSFDSVDLSGMLPSRIAKRTALITHLISPATPLKQPTLSTFPPTIPDVSLSIVGKTSSKSTHEKNPAKYLRSDTDYAFCIQDNRHAGFVIANGWKLYPRWQWFARLVNAGLEEAKTRIIHMPAWMTSNTLLAILSAPHGTAHTQMTHLAVEEMTSILQHGKELGLLDSAGNAAPVFKILVKRCCDKVLEPLSNANCFKMLNRLVQIGMEDKVEEALSYISTHKDNLSIKNIILLDAELIEILKERLK